MMYHFFEVSAQNSLFLSHERGRPYFALRQSQIPMVLVTQVNQVILQIISKSFKIGSRNRILANYSRPPVDSSSKVRTVLGCRVPINLAKLRAFPVVPQVHDN